MSGRDHATVGLNAVWAARSSGVHASGLRRLEMRYRVLATAALISATVLLAGPSVAQPYRARQGVQAGEMRSLDEILNGIRRQRPGNLADVEGPNPSPGGEPQYRLKWVTPDGRVLWLGPEA